MTPAHCRTLGRFSVDAAAWDGLREWLMELQPPEAAAQTAAVAEESVEVRASLEAEASGSSRRASAGAAMHQPFRPAAGGKLPPLSRPIEDRAAKHATHGPSSSPRFTADLHRGTPPTCSS